MKSFTIAFVSIFWFQLVLAQEVIETVESEVLGSVKNTDNEPIRGVNVFVDSIKTRVKTNRKGEFKIMLASDTKEVAVFSEIYGLISVPYNDQSKLNFIFPKDFKVIGEKELASLGYTIKASKKVKKVKDYSKYLDVYQLLVAEVPGVMVNGKSIRLRGTASNSVNSGQEPLIIIDGTQASSVDNIRPQEIKSIRVVRDEGASFYGARGANGVIVIQMKNSG